MPDLEDLIKNFDGSSDYLSKISELLSDPNPDINGDKPLILAAKYGHLEIVEMLLQMGIDVNQEGKQKNTALIEASTHGHFEIVRFLVDRGAKINQPDINMHTPVLNAIHKGYIDIVQYLIHRGADIEKFRPCNNPLSVAIHHNIGQKREDLVNMLIAAGVNINDTSSIYYNPLIYACLMEKDKICPRIIEILLASGADPNMLDKDGSNSLMKISQHFGEQSSIEVVRILIAAGANVNNQCENGETPLIRAISHYTPEKLELIKVLIDAGADVNLCDKNGETPLIKTCQYNPVRKLFNLLKILIRAGADVNIQDLRGRSPLFEIACHSHSNTMKYIDILLQAGANPNLLDHKANNILINVMYNYRNFAHIYPFLSGFLQEEIRTFLRIGVDPTIENSEGDTSLKLSLEFPELVRIFLEERIIYPLNLIRKCSSVIKEEFLKYTDDPETCFQIIGGDVNLFQRYLQIHHETQMKHDFRNRFYPNP